jgi:hypothetical protein
MLRIILFSPWHSRITCTLPLTETPMSANLSCRGQVSGAGAGVHSHWFLDDKAICKEFSNSLAGVGIRDFVQFVGIKPDLAFTAASNGGGEPLLGPQVHPG